MRKKKKKGENRHQGWFHGFCPETVKPRCLQLRWGSLWIEKVLDVGTNPEFPVTTQQESWVSHWDSRGNPSYPLQLEKRPDSPAATWDEPQVPHRNSRGILSFPLKLERNPELPTSTQEEAQFPCYYSRWTPSSPSQIKMSPKHWCNSRGFPRAATPTTIQEENSTTTREVAPYHS